MLARSLEVTLGGEKVGETPMLVPAFSSRVCPDIDQVIEYMGEFIVDQVLISAYDLHHGNLRTIPTYATAIFLDSGGYECSDNVELSELGSVKKERERLSEGQKQRQEDWNEEYYCQVLEQWPTDIATSHTVVVSYDHPDIRHPLQDQIQSAQKLFADREDFLKEILLKPETKDQSLVQIDMIVQNIESLEPFDIVGFTEKELGSSILQRMINIARIRIAMEEKGLVRPLHIFGSLDTIGTLLYYIAGADIFDGLTWLRYSYLDGLTVYWQNYGAGEMISASDRMVRRKILVDNIYYLAFMREQMMRYSVNGRFEHFGRNAQLLERARDSLLSRVPATLEV